METRPSFFDGQWVEPAGTGTIPVENPGVWSGSDDRVTAVARRMRGAFNPPARFGGYKQSGGRELGPHGLTEFLETKAIQR
jgi:aldehyde dehydrogenase (NAD+)